MRPQDFQNLEPLLGIVTVNMGLPKPANGA